MRGQLSLEIPHSVRYPQSVIRDHVRNPEPHAGFNVGLGPRTGFGVQRGIQDEVRDPEFCEGREPRTPASMESYPHKCSFTHPYAYARKAELLSPLFV